MATILKVSCSNPLSSIFRAKARSTLVRLSCRNPLLPCSFQAQPQIYPATRQARAMTSNHDGENGNNGDDGALEGELNQWKFRAPYQIHQDNSDFHARYEGSCHCGKIHYQLSREKPLDAKYCHCTTCQKIHGKTFPPGADTELEIIT